MAKAAIPVVTAQLTLEQAKLGIERLKKRLAEVTAFDPRSIDFNNPTASVASLRTSIDETLVRTFGHDTLQYKRFREAAFFRWPVRMGGTPPQRIFDALVKCRQTSISLLEAAISSLEELIEELPYAEITLAAESSTDVPITGNRKVFIVHGHDVAARETVARFLANCDFEPIILHEMANEGKTIIEKFEHHADVGFAVALMTPDDFGGVSRDKLEPRARQNVILELGYFIGRLGRNRVVALKAGNIELPSDVIGVAWVELDKAGAWKQQLGKELDAASYEVNWKKIMRN